MGDKAFVFGLRFVWRIPGVGFEGDVLLKGVCGLDFEGIKGAYML